LDGTILVLLGWGYESRLRAAWPTLVAAGLVAPLAVELALSPDLTAYYGTSGLTHTLMAAAVVFELAHRRRWIVWLAAGGLAWKLGWGLFGTGPMFGPDIGAGVRETPIAHLVGALAGACIAGLSGKPSSVRVTARTPG
jgi:peptidoglycan/LPS O-acetylase OafA/YrhL